MAMTRKDNLDHPESPVPANVLFASWLIGEDMPGAPHGRSAASAVELRAGSGIGPSAGSAIRPCAESAVEPCAGSANESGAVTALGPVFEEQPVDRGSDREAKGRSHNLADYAYGVQWDWQDAPKSHDGLRGAVNPARIPAQRRPIVSAPFGQLSAVFFDLDGTLIESEEVWNDAVRRLARDRGAVATDELLAKTHGLDSHRAMRLIHESLSWPADQVEHHVAWVAGAVADTMRAGVIWRPGAVALVSALRAAGVPIALVTSSYRDIVEIALGDSVEISFDAVVCGDEVDSPKPHPEPYLTAAELLEVDVRRSVAIEDSPMGAASARGAGCAVLYVSEATTSPDVDATRKSLVGVDLAMLVKLLVEAGRIP
jgi:HAD superfamily hydrolase (TIGR01509 family)